MQLNSQLWLVRRVLIDFSITAWLGQQGFYYQCYWSDFQDNRGKGKKREKRFSLIKSIELEVIFVCLCLCLKEWRKKNPAVLSVRSFHVLFFLYISKVLQLKIIIGRSLQCQCLTVSGEAGTILTQEKFKTKGSVLFSYMTSSTS